MLANGGYLISVQTFSSPLYVCIAPCGTRPRTKGNPRDQEKKEKEKKREGHVPNYAFVSQLPQMHARSNCMSRYYVAVALLKVTSITERLKEKIYVSRDL
jgi:hypothetical protein